MASTPSDARSPSSTPPGRGFHAAVLLIVLAWTLLNLPFLIGHSAIPWDSLDEFFPQVRFIVDAVWHGEAPWWNPYLHGGQPVLGDPQGMIFTPQTLIGIVCGRHFNRMVFDLTTLSCELAGGIALARYARSYADSRTLPILGAVVFMAGGVATSRLQHVPQIVSYSLLPLQLLALRAGCRRPTALRTALLALVLASVIMNPNQVVFLSGFALLPFALWHLHQSQFPRRAILGIAIAALIALLADAPMLSAMLEFMRLSNREQFDLAASASSSFPWFNAASIMLPGLYGVLSPRHGFWAPTDLSQDVLYIGVIPLAAALSSLTSPRRMPAVTALSWGSAVVWFVFAVGTHSPFYPALFRILPGLAAFRRPADGAYLLNFSLALLVGTARLPNWRSRAASAATLVTAVALVGMFGGACVSLLLYAQRVGHAPDLLPVAWAWALRIAVGGGAALLLRNLPRSTAHAVAAPLLAALTVTDLAAAGRWSAVFAPPVHTSDVAQIFSDTLAWDTPRTPLEQSVTFLRNNATGEARPPYRMEALGGSLAGSMPIAFGIATTQGYDPLWLRSYGDVVGVENLAAEAKRFTPAAPDYNSPVYRRLGLRYVLLHRFIIDHPWDFGETGVVTAQIRAEFVASDWAELVNAPGTYEIWRLRNAMPKAMLRTDDGTQHACDILAYQTVTVSVRCRSADPGLLVLGDPVAPGWRACVNGAPVPVEPYQGLFRAVSLPAGDNRVTFRYQAVPFLRSHRCGK